MRNPPHKWEFGSGCKPDTSAAIGNNVALLADNQDMRKTFAALAATMVATGGLGLAGLGLASGTAQADIGPVPLYHWCPGDFWDQGWGDNWEWGACHDDHHRDMDGWDHNRDWWGDRGGDWRGGDWQGDRGGNWQGDRGGNWQGDEGGRADHGGPQPGQPWWPGGR
ncbi:MAG: hypothetical protein JWR32_4183 [Mycobacterium sp.]|nr:hypothetical protein [Mycobacterium sp.]